MSRNRFVPLLLGPLAILLLLGAAATPAAAQSSDEEAIASYTLTMPKVKAYYETTQALTEVVMKDSALAKRMQADADQDSDQESLTQMAAKLEKYPQIKAVLTAHGLTGRENMLIALTLMQASLAQGLLSSNPNAKLPEGINPKNVEFVRQHQDELKQLAADMQKWQEGLGGEE